MGVSWWSIGGHRDRADGPGYVRLHGYLGRIALDTDLLVTAAREVREFAKNGLSDDSPSRRLRLLERSPVLRGLPPVQEAGSESGAQFVYLVQAIVDAIDEIDRTVSPLTATSSVTHISGGAREAQALRALFGLTDQTRIRTWRVRQEAAANSLNVSWEHFRRDTQESLLRSLCECILRAALEDGQQPFNLRSLAPGLSVFATQKDIEALIVDYIHETRPQSAVMLELSTATIGPILRALRDSGARIRLLAANPERSSYGWQRARINKSLIDLLRIDFRDYDALSIRLYSVPPSLRGRNIGELITVGWYTHRDNKRLEILDPASNEVWGHDNIVVAGRSSEEHGAMVSKWFHREFERLWLHRSTREETASKRILGLPE